MNWAKITEAGTCSTTEIPDDSYASTTTIARFNKALLEAARDSDWITALTAVAEIEDEADRLRAFFVHKARGDGATWRKIGEAYGVTDEAAHIRHLRTQRPNPMDDTEGR